MAELNKVWAGFNVQEIGGLSLNMHSVWNCAHELLGRIRYVWLEEYAHMNK